VSATLGPPAPATAGAPPSAAAPAASRAAAPASPTLVRLAVFFALAAFGAGHWAALVEDPSMGRTLLVVLVATAGGALIALLGTARVRAALTAALGGRPRAAGALVSGGALLTGLGTILLGLGAAGLSLRLLGPNNWPELADGLDRGLAGVQGVEWPYSGPDEWIRRTVLLGAPVLLGLAATLAFFPARRGGSLLRGAALVLLLLLYGAAVTEQEPGAPLLRGLALLLLVAAWLWLPRLHVREAAAGAALVCGLGVLSLPVAAALDSEDPWWDYHAWEWFGGGKVVTFDWDHRYGPLNWPRDGTTLLNVESRQRQYWKAETLDTFDGFRWVRTPAGDSSDPLDEIPIRTRDIGRGWDYYEYNPRWEHEFRVTVRSLSSNLIVGAGITYLVKGAGAHSISGDGTITKTGDPLREGDSYTTHSYVPNPTARQMRGAPEDYPAALQVYTSIELPDPSASALDDQGTVSLTDTESIRMPMRNSTVQFGDPEAPARALEQSVYSEMYERAVGLTEDAPTVYAAVKRIERYLNSNFTYSEKTRPAENPLNAFLFRDGFGYCQQFSGTMALMLRMAGIPARVAAGFAPGSFNRDEGEYRVRDLDAHSWVEVYFNGIGWVAFDPTPAASPADSQAADLLPAAAAASAIGSAREGAAASERAQEGATSPLAEQDDGASPILLLPLLLLGVAGVVAVRLVRRRAALSSEELADAQLAELRRALDRLNWNVPAATTLLALERRLGRTAGPASARYAAALRAHRYDPRVPEAPSLRERRALRRELARGGGLGSRLRGLLAIPPGGPRPV
jgi:protein-glutamine gamma-glutamyltransferase